MACETKELTYKAVAAKLARLPANRSLLTNLAAKLDSLIRTSNSDVIKLEQFKDKTLLDFIGIRDGSRNSLLAQEEIFESPVALKDALIERGIAENQAKELSRLFFRKGGFLSTFQKNYLFRTPYADAPFHILAQRENGKETVPRSVVFGMMLVSYQWVATAELSPYADRGNLGNLFYGDFQALLTAEDIQIGRELGHSRPLVIEQLGNSIVDALNLKPKDNNDARYFYDGLVSSIGLAAVKTLAEVEDGLVVQESPQYKFNFEETVDERIYATGDKFPFVKLTSAINDVRPEAPYAEIASLFRNLDSGIDLILDTETDRNDISDRPIKSVPNKAGSFSPVKLSEKVKEVIASLQKRAWTMNQSSSLFDKMLTSANAEEIQQPYEVLLRLEGWVDIGPYRKANAPQDLIERIEAKNESVIRDVNNLIEYRDAGRLKKFYIRYKPMVQGRLMQMGKINPQNSKAHRHYFVPEEANVTVNEQNIGWFKLAVAQWFDQDPDKAKSVEQVFRTFDTIYANPKVQQALDALDANDINTFSNIVRELALDGYTDSKGIFVSPPYQGNWSVVDAMYALQQYRNANNGKEEFSSSLMIESDGITNGFAIGIALFSESLNEKRLYQFNQTGTYIKDNSEALKDTPPSELYDHSEHTGKPDQDIYVNVGTSLVNSIRKLAYVDNALEMVRLYKSKENVKYEDDLGRHRHMLAIEYFYKALSKPRTLAKQPFMIFMYGAGSSRIAREMREEIVVEIQKTFVDLQIEFNNLDATDALFKQKQNAIISEAKVALEHLNMLYVDPAVLTKAIVNQSSSDLVKWNLEQRNPFIKLNVETALKNNKLAKSIKAPTRKGFKLDNPARHFNSIFNSPPANSSLQEVGEGSVTIFKDAIETAMSLEVADITETRNEIIGALEIVNTIFAIELGKYLQQWTDELGRQPTNREILEGIASTPELYKFYPKVKNLTSEDGAEVDLGLFRATEKSGRSVKYHDKNNPKGSKSEVGTIALAEIGPRGIVRMIQNLDSQIMNGVIDRTPNMLNIYDAVLSSLDAINLSQRTYGKEYLRNTGGINYVQQVHDLFDVAWSHAQSQGDKYMSRVLGLPVYSDFFKEKKKALSGLRSTLQGKAVSIDKVHKVLKDPNRTISFQMYLPDASQTIHGNYLKGIVRESVYEEVAEIDTSEINKLFDQPASKIRVPAIKQLYMKLFDANKADADNWWNTVKLMSGSTSLADQKAEAKADMLRTAVAAREVQDDIKYSLNIDEQNTTTYYTRKNIATDLKDLFNSLINRDKSGYANQQNRNEHIAALRDVLTRLVQPVVDMYETSVSVSTTDVISNGNFNPVNQHINVNVRDTGFGAFSEQGPQEVLVHEMLHAVAKNMLAEDSALRREVEQLYRQAAKTATYEMFLNYDSDGNIIAKNGDVKAEIEAAKRMFNYVFGARGKLNQIEEFFVYGLTNEHMIRWGKKTDVVHDKKKKKILSRLLEILDNILRKFNVMVKRAPRDSSVHARLFAIAEQMTRAQRTAHTKDGMLKRAESFSFDKLRKGNAKFVKAAAFAARKYVRPISPTRNWVLRAAKLAYNTSVLHYTQLHKQNKYLQVLERQANIMSGNLLAELGEGVLDARFIGRLLEKKARVEAAREHISEEEYKYINNAFLTEVTDEEKRMLTKAILKTDLTALFGIDLDSRQIFELLEDMPKVRTLIADLLRDLGIKNMSPIDLATNDLAKVMVDGRAETAMLDYNAAEIARNHLQSVDPEIIAKLDALITLRAVLQTNPIARTITARVARREYEANPKVNGASDLLLRHVMYKEQSLSELFDGNMTLMQKGYIQQILPSLTEILIAPAADKKKLKREGYEFVSDVKKLRNIPVGEQLAIYINPNSPDPSKTTGMFSVEKLHNSGTTLSEMLARLERFQTPEGAVDRKKIKKFISRYKAEQEDLAKRGFLDPEGAQMIPLKNDSGKVVDFRIQMPHDILELYAKQRLEIDTVMARQKANTLVKINGVKENVITADLLSDHAEQNFTKLNKKNWVNIFDPKYFADTLGTLPRPTQKYIRSIATKNPDKSYEFYVPKEMLNAVFGFANYSAGDIRLLEKIPGSKRAVKVAESVWQAIVANAVSRIVIGLPEVIYANMHSNFYSMIVKGIPPSFLVKKLTEGAREILQFKEDAIAARELYDYMKVHNIGLDSPEARELNVLRLKLASNKVAGMVAAGMFTTIAEDYDPTSDHGYEGRVEQKWRKSKLNKRTPKTLQKIGGMLYGTKNSVPFKALEETVQISDFISRYALMEWRKTQGWSKERAFKEAMDTFVNYNEPMSKGLTYANSMGGVMFVKFFMRANRVGFSNLRNNPVSLATAAGIGHATDINMLGVYGDTIYGGRLLPQIAPADNIIEQAADPIGIRLIADGVEGVITW